MEVIIRWCLRNKPVVVLATIVVIVSGAYATTRLNQELIPALDFPVVTVSTPVPGAGPDVVDEQVTQPVEGAVEGVEGIEGIRSTSSQGFSVVVVEFGLDKDTEGAEAEISSALDGVALPQQAAEPEVARQSFSQFPILNVSVSSADEDLAGVTDYVREEAVPLIEEVEGVASADLVGGSERQVEVELDPARLQQAGLPADAVIGAISGASVNAPAGTVRVEGLSTPVRASNGPVDAETLRELPLGVGGPSAGMISGASPGGAPAGEDAGASAAAAAGATGRTGSAEPVLLGDVAEVREVDADLSGISRTNGEPSLGINVVKEADANTVEVAAGVEEALDEVRDELGEDRVLVVSNSAEAVEESVNGLVEKALIGGILAVLIIFVFLRSLRATLVTAVSLPVSILAALLFSWGYDLSLNIITLAGLTIAVGRVVDDAIVVLENTYRYVQRGDEPEEAALKGTVEVASAITSSTLTTVAVFLPLGLVGGIVSEFFLPLSLTVSFALLASLLVAVTIIPVLVSVFVKRQGRRTGSPEGSDLRESRRERRRGGRGREGDGWLGRLYAPALRWSLRHRLIVVLFALVAFGGGVAAVPFLGVTFFPQSEERLLQADVELPAGTALEETAEGLRPFEEFLLDDRGVESYALSVGGESVAGASDSPVRPDNQAQAFVNLSEDADVAETVERVGEEGRRLYGENFKVQIVQNGPPSGGLEVTLTGGNEDELRRASDLVTAELSDVGGVANVESDLSEVSPEIEARLDDRLVAQAGLSSSQIPATVGALLGGGRSVEVGEETVNVGVSEGAVDSAEEVARLPLGPGVAVSDVAEVSEDEAPAEITRVDGERAVTVTAEITTEDTNAVSAEAQSALDRLDLPEGITATLGGESEDIAESFRNLIICVAVAIVLVYVVLVVFFGSLAVPLVILLSVPLITSGSFGALLLTGTPLSLPALLGVLLLIGIVVSNAILIVDFARNARDRHESVDGALVEAGRARLRPILMTALATIFALVPLALGISLTGTGGSGGLISSGLAIPVVGGLITSTLLTLFVVPVGYSLLEAGRRKGGRGRRGEELLQPEPAATGRDRLASSESVPAGSAASLDGSSGGERYAAAGGNGEVASDSRDEVIFELGRARGRTEVLERQLERLETADSVRGTGRSGRKGEG